MPRACSRRCRVIGSCYASVFPHVSALFASVSSVSSSARDRRARRRRCRDTRWQRPFSVTTIRFATSRPTSPTRYVGGILRKKTVERGRMAVRKPGRMRWTYTQPEEKLFVSDGNRVYSYVPADKQVYVAAVPADDQATTPALFLAGKGNILRDFTVVPVDVPDAPAGSVAAEIDAEAPGAGIRLAEPRGGQVVARAADARHIRQPGRPVHVRIRQSAREHRHRRTRSSSS